MFAGEIVSYIARYCAMCILQWNQFQTLWDHAHKTILNARQTFDNIIDTWCTSSKWIQSFVWLVRCTGGCISWTAHTISSGNNGCMRNHLYRSFNGFTVSLLFYSLYFTWIYYVWVWSTWNTLYRCFRHFRAIPCIQMVSNGKNMHKTNFSFVWCFFSITFGLCILFHRLNLPRTIHFQILV